MRTDRVLERFVGDPEVSCIQAKFQDWDSVCLLDGTLGIVLEVRAGVVEDIDYEVSFEDTEGAEIVRIVPESHLRMAVRK